MFRRLLIPLLLFAVSSLYAKNEAVMRDASDFAAFRDELEKMQNSASEESEAKDQIHELLGRLQEIASMYDQCGFISLTEMLDPKCSQLLESEVPQFENDYMRITSEIRLSSISGSVKTLQERAENLQFCSDEVARFLLSPDRLISISNNRNLGLEPLDRDLKNIEVSYSFTIGLNKKKMRTLKNWADLWISKCGDVVLTPEHDGLARMFMSNLQTINTQVENEDKIDAKIRNEGFKLYFSSRDRMFSKYVFGGTTLFSTENESVGDYLVIDLDPQNGTAESGSSRWTFDSKKEIYLGPSYNFDNLEGRLIWEKRPNYNYDSGINYNYNSSDDCYNCDYSDYSSSSYNYDYNNNYSSSSYSYDDDCYNCDYEEKPSKRKQASSSIETNFRFSFLGGLNFSLPAEEVNENTVWDYPALVDQKFNDNGFVMFMNAYLMGMVILDIENFAIGVGGGFTYNSVSVSGRERDVSESAEDFDSVLTVRTALSPIASVEVGYFSSWELGTKDKPMDLSVGIGVRGTYVFDNLWPTVYVGPFVEFGALGIEVGYQQTKDFWNTTYIAAYLRFPTKGIWKEVSK